jgi:16S rRNA G966 N2-methylase RsmD
MRYGIPYRGSKSRIAKWVISNLPSANTFVDLFAGGCAVTHAAMLSGKYNNFIANDLTQGPNIFMYALIGGFENMEGGITREQFNTIDNANIPSEEREAIKLLYSFGNNRTDYLWSNDIEEVKVPAERMLSAPSLHERRMEYKKFLRALIKYINKYKTNNINNKFECLQGLEGLERLERLRGLKNLECLRVSNLDYREVKIPENAVVYADPPYRNTRCTGYRDFSPQEFDELLSTVSFPVYVSERICPKDCVEISRKERMCSMAAKCNTPTIEKLFIQKRFVKG